MWQELEPLLMAAGSGGLAACGLIYRQNKTILGRATKAVCAVGVVTLGYIAGESQFDLKHLDESRVLAAQAVNVGALSCDPAYPEHAQYGYTRKGLIGKWRGIRLVASKEKIVAYDGKRQLEISHAKSAGNYDVDACEALSEQFGGFGTPYHEVHLANGNFAVDIQTYGAQDPAPAAPDRASASASKPAPK